MKSVNYSFSDLVDTDKIMDLLISFYDLTGILLVLEDLDGNILTCADGSCVAVGWQDICLNFHREHPETLKKCIESDTKLSNGLKSGERYSCYTCLNGLVDVAVPIYVDGEHLANIFTGQFFFELPDIEFFKKQAGKYSFDEEEYLNALSKVPVFPSEFIEKGMGFITDLASIIGEMGLEKKKLLDSKRVLQESEKRFHMLIDNSTDLICILDEEGFIIFDSPSSKRILGYSDGYFIGKSPLEFIHPDDVERVKRDLQEVYEKRNHRIPTEFRIRRADGEYIPVESISQNLTNINGVNGIVVTAHPIIERKNNENMLQFQANILNNVRDCVIVYDFHGKIIYWNKGAETIYGYLEKEIMGKNIKTLYLNTDQDQFTPDLREIMETGEYNGEWEGKRKDGSSVHVDIRETIMHDVNGEVIGIIGVSKDITERKEAEKALNDSERQLRMITDNMMDMVSQTDVNGVLQYVSPSHSIILGYNLENLLGRTIFDFVHPHDLEKVGKSYKTAMHTMEPNKIEFRFRHADGHYMWLEVMGNILFGENHLIKGSVFGARDISDRKKVEKQIKRSESYYRTIFENTGTATIIVEEDTTISLVNAEFEKLYGYSKEEIEGKKSWKQFVLDDYINKIEGYHNIRRIDPKLAPRNYEFKFVDRYGNIKDVFTTVAIISGTKKSLISLLDITEIKMAENKIKESLMEKEVLLREIHHRVKNNLQIISSLLNLQARCVDGEETINVLKESQNRIKTMAMVHEKLYQSANLKDINLKEYVENLVSGLFYSYGVKRGTIKPQVHVDALKIDIDTAIPCGLIINELVTNSLKYAFPAVVGREQSNEGIIKVQLERLNNNLELIVSDNGIGLPEDVDMEHIETLGLKMVNVLVNQLGGTLELDRTVGIRFKIIFKELKYEDRI